MLKSNKEVKEAMKNFVGPRWLIAAKLGVHENTLYRWLRTEMPPDKKVKVLRAIKELESKAVIEESI